MYHDDPIWRFIAKESGESFESITRVFEALCSSRAKQSDYADSKEDLPSYISRVSALERDAVARILEAGEEYRISCPPWEKRETLESLADRMLREHGAEIRGKSDVEDASEAVN
jgi:hypothetical protein